MKKKKKKERKEKQGGKKCAFNTLCVRLDPITTCTLPIIPTAINHCTRFACKLDDSSKPTTRHRSSLTILRASALSNDTRSETCLENTENSSSRTRRIVRRHFSFLFHFFFFFFFVFYIYIYVCVS